jgi:hypothetical protein
MRYRAKSLGFIRANIKGRIKSREVLPGEIFELLPGQRPGSWMEEVVEAKPEAKKPDKPSA